MGEGSKIYVRAFLDVRPSLLEEKAIMYIETKQKDICLTRMIPRIELVVPGIKMVLFKQLAQKLAENDNE